MPITVALTTTDLSLVITQILEQDSARWKNASGIKEHKHEIDSQKILSKVGEFSKKPLKYMYEYYYDRLD